MRGRCGNVSNIGSSHYALQDHTSLSPPSLHSGSQQQVDSLQNWQSPLSQSHVHQHQTSVSERDPSYPETPSSTIEQYNEYHVPEVDLQPIPSTSEHCKEYHVHHNNMSDVKLTSLSKSGYHCSSNESVEKCTKAKESGKVQRICATPTQQTTEKQQQIYNINAEVSTDYASRELASVRKSAGVYTQKLLSSVCTQVCIINRRK